MTNPVVVTDTLFGLSERRRGQFFALDSDTGTTLWLGPPRQAENTAIVKSERLLFLLNDDAELIVARATRAAFAPIVRYTVADSATWAQPAISGNRVFVKDVGKLTLWTIPGLRGKKSVDGENARRQSVRSAVTGWTRLARRAGR